MSKEEIEFVDGLIVKAPRETAPPYVKASISIKVEDLGKWLRAKYKAGEEWVNIDVKESKKGTWYASVSTWKPKEDKSTKNQLGTVDRRNPGDEESDVPF